MAQQDPWQVVASKPLEEDPWKVVETRSATPGVLQSKSPFFGGTRGEKAADAVQQMLTNPENRSALGAMGGGYGGAVAGMALGGPPGAVIGGLGGTILGGFGGSLTEGKDAGAAMKEAAWEGLFAAPTAGMPLAGKPTAKLGKNLVQHSFGPQNAVIKEFGEDIAGDALEQLTRLKLERTGTFAPVSGRTAIRQIQSQIDDAIAGRAAVLAGEAGDRPVTTRALWSSVETPQGITVSPVKDVYTRLRKQFTPTDDVKAASGELRKVFDNPAIGTYESYQKAAPPLPKEVMVAMDNMGVKLTPEMEASIRSQLGLKGGGEAWSRNMRSHMPARDMQELVSGTYKKVDNMGGYMNDAATAPKRDMLKALARAGKEEYTRVVPEALPFNKEMEALIPLREALIAAEAGVQNDPLVRLGETFALATGRPQMAVGSLLNRPKFESMLGQSLYNAGNAAQKGTENTTALMQLVKLLMNGGEESSPRMSGVNVSGLGGGR